MGKVVKDGVGVSKVVKDGVGVGKVVRVGWMWVRL